MEEIFTQRKIDIGKSGNKLVNMLHSSKISYKNRQKKIIVTNIL
jgi:hypothetical protein